MPPQTSALKLEGGVHLNLVVVTWVTRTQPHRAAAYEDLR
jgi:hypothetical protein